MGNSKNILNTTAKKMGLRDKTIAFRVLIIVRILVCVSLGRPYEELQTKPSEIFPKSNLIGNSDTSDWWSYECDYVDLFTALPGISKNICLEIRENFEYFPYQRCSFKYYLENCGGLGTKT